MPDINLRYYGTGRVAIDLATGVSFSPWGKLPDVRSLPYPALGYSVPVEAAKDIPALIKDQYPSLSVSLAPDLSFHIERELSRERAISGLATANDGEVTEGVLTLEPRELQRAAINYLEHDDSSKILALRMGLGKTLVATWIAEKYNRPTLWITKASLVLNLEREIYKLSGKRACVFRGRFPAQEDMQALFSETFQHFIINYEVLGTQEDNVWPWVDIFNTAAKLKLIKMIVADEAHACKNIDSQRSRALLRLKAERHLPMSGSPVINRVDELWPLLHWVAPERFNSRAAFTNAHTFDGKSVRNPKKLQQELLPFIFYRSLNDVGQMPPLVSVHHGVSLPAYAQARYEAALKGVYLALDGNEQEISGPLAELNRLRDIVADAKADSTVEYVQSILEEDPNAKVLVFSEFVSPVRQIAAELGAEAIYGELSQDERIARVDRFEAGESRVLTLTRPVGGEGLNITSATHIVFNDFAWSPEHHAQAISRAYARLSNLHGVHVTYVEIADTVDEFMGTLLVDKAQTIAMATSGVVEQGRQSGSIIRDVLDWIRENR